MTTLAPSPLGLRRTVHQYVRGTDGRLRGRPALRAYSYATVAGLVLAEWPATVHDPHPRYTITHIPTGARVGEHTYLTMADAEAALGRVAGLFDWTLAGPEIRKAFDQRCAQDQMFQWRLIGALAPIAMPRPNTEER